MQALGAIFQVILLTEMERNLEHYEETLLKNCVPHKQHGICLGPAWNLSYSGQGCSGEAALERLYSYQKLP